MWKTGPKWKSRRWVVRDPKEIDKIERRWTKVRNRDYGEYDVSSADGIDGNDDQGMAEHYGRTECVGCAYFIRLEPPLNADWGVCSNDKSTFDGRVMNEHDGCNSCVVGEDGTKSRMQSES